MERADKIIKTALSFWGETELPENSGFVNKTFESYMRMMGWSKGQPWCMYFVKLVIAESGFKVDGISGSVVKTWQSLKGTQIPSKGSMVFWQYYKDGKPLWTGHAGIVIRAYADKIVTIEGNTNDDGSRDGVEVSIHVRKLDFTNNNGLRLLGFV